MDTLRLRSVTATAVDVPMKRPLVTSVQTIRSAPMVLVDLLTEEGVTGRAYVFCYLRRLAPAVKAALAEIDALCAGAALAPRDLFVRVKRHFRLVGATGIVNTAIAGFDMACWDAAARAAGQPLGRLLGSGRSSLPAYNSNGLGMSAPEALADEALALLEGGFKAVKIRLGRADPAADLAAVRAVQRVLPAGTALMADYNQALSRTEAQQRCRALDGEGLYWIEEPIRHDDYAGAAALSTAITTPVQIGENFVGATAMALALEAGACDYCMPDVERIGGVTGWLDAAALAATQGMPMSSHLMPEVSAHLLAASPTAHWLEYVDWADAVLAQPLRIADGQALLSDTPGSGLEWNPDAVQRLRFD